MRADNAVVGALGTVDLRVAFADWQIGVGSPDVAGLVVDFERMDAGFLARHWAVRPFLRLDAQAVDAIGVEGAAQIVLPFLSSLMP